jgi:hypothetical protein
MRTLNNTHNDFVLSRHPHQVTVGEIRSWIKQDDENGKKLIIDFIYHRLDGRFIQPMLHIPPKYRSGFLMMALASLLIETMQSFHKGKNDTRARKNDKESGGSNAFSDFFKRERVFFPGFDSDDVNFYENIRCGILHQAETTGGYRIWRKGLLFNPEKKTINADLFVEAIKACLDKYIADLRVSESSSTLWKNAVKKVECICKNCES